MSHVVTTFRSQTNAQFKRARKRFNRGATAEPSELAPPHPSLSAPLVTLYVTPNRHQESLDAFAVLSEARTGFSVELAEDGRVAAEFAGRMQFGIDGVQKLKDALLQFEHDFLRADAELDPIIARMRKDGVREQAEKELACQIKSAQQELYRLLA